MYSKQEYIDAAFDREILATERREETLCRARTYLKDYHRLIPEDAGLAETIAEIDRWIKELAP